MDDLILIKGPSQPTVYHSSVLEIWMYFYHNYRSLCANLIYWICADCRLFWRIRSAILKCFASSISYNYSVTAIPSLMLPYIKKYYSTTALV